MLAKFALERNIWLGNVDTFGNVEAKAFLAHNETCRDTLGCVSQSLELISETTTIGNNTACRTFKVRRFFTVSQKCHQGAFNCVFSKAPQVLVSCILCVVDVVVKQVYSYLLSIQCVSMSRRQMSQRELHC
jgi:hypothetical protein